MYLASRSGAKPAREQANGHVLCVEIEGQAADRLQCRHSSSQLVGMSVVFVRKFKLGEQVCFVRLLD